MELPVEDQRQELISEYEKLLFSLNLPNRNYKDKEKYSKGLQIPSSLDRKKI